MKDKILIMAVLIIAIALSAQSFFFWKFNNNAHIITRYEEGIRKADANLMALFQKLRDLKNTDVDKLLPKLPEPK